ncbi:MAG: tRNA pseudouridine(13) synthase TruD [Phycisphaerales bacterium]|nr:MAG: tRNA pseudouridine(13) synthase TruD [Phycisphaerales bacterium]
MADGVQAIRLPFLTPDLPGIGGRIKAFDEDFLVEELPRYQPCGQGTHVYFTIEKRGLTTMAAVAMIAKALGRPARDIGFAGQKDAHAITRQALSLEHVDPARIERLQFARIRVLSVSRHTNKLKLGHLSGNRFAIRVRDVAAGAADRARAVLAVLAVRGVPNYFGPQRFGVRGDNGVIGAAALRGDYEEAIRNVLGRPGPFDRPPISDARRLFDAGQYEKAAALWPAGFTGMSRVCRALARTGGDFRAAWLKLDLPARKFYLSACQSEVFNRVLAARVSGLDRLLTGDVAYKHNNGACFVVEDAGLEQPRCDAFEISPTGPLPGRRLTPAQGEPGRIEQSAIEASGMSGGSFHAPDGMTLHGERRPLRVPLADPSVEPGRDERGDFVELRFTLPPGVYATSVTREVCKE